MVSIASKGIKATSMASYTGKQIEECRYSTQYYKTDPLCNKMYLWLTHKPQFTEGIFLHEMVGDFISNSIRLDTWKLGGVSDVSFKNVMMSLVNVGKLYHDNFFLEVKEKSKINVNVWK